MNKENRCLIITGGTVDIEFAKEYIKEKVYELVIAVDKGLDAANEIGCNVDIVLGDFDSVNQSILQKYVNESKVRRLNPIKDLTDTEDAILVALNEKITELTILGATGTRLDHTLANINLLLKPLKKSVKACILDKHNRISLIDKEFKIKKKEQFGPYISLLPLTTKVTGITLEGMKYPLFDYTMTVGGSLGVSNEISEETATIRIKEGVLIVIESRD